MVTDSQDQERSPTEQGPPSLSEALLQRRPAQRVWPAKAEIRPSKMTRQRADSDEAYVAEPIPEPVPAARKRWGWSWMITSA